MFVVTLNKASLKKFGIGAMCCALVAFSALLGRYISTRTVSVSASVNKIESAQDIQTWFMGYGLDVDGASITADKVKIPRKWDDSFSAFNGVVQQSGLDLARYKGKTVEKWTALIPAGLLVKVVKGFSSTATLEKNGKTCDLRKLMALMGMGVKQGETVTIKVEGEDEDAAAEAIQKFLSENV